MNKCKNNECDNIILKKNNVYCSLKCRNIYVNKNIRDYSIIKQRRPVYDNYLNNPKKCEFCKCDLEYKKRWNKYCSSSCSAKHTNVGKVKSVETRKKISNAIYEACKDNLLEIECKYCQKKIKKKINRLFCDKECARKQKRKHLGEIELYRIDCKFRFSLNDYPNEFDFELLKKYGMYKAKNKGNNLGGVSKDHIYSISEGFKNGVPSEIISHPANCQLLIHSHNVSKFKKCHISIKELKEKIINWEKNMGNIFQN